MPVVRERLVVARGGAVDLDPRVGFEREPAFEQVPGNETAGGAGEQATEKEIPH